MKHPSPADPDPEHEAYRRYIEATAHVNRGEYGHALQKLAEVSKLDPAHPDPSGLRTRITAALADQQRDTIFDDAKAEAQTHLQAQRWAEVKPLVNRLQERLAAENLRATDDQRAEINRWLVDSIRRGRPRQGNERGTHVFHPTSRFQPPTSGTTMDNRRPGRPPLQDRLPMWYRRTKRLMGDADPAVVFVVYVAVLFALLLLTSRL